MLVFRTVLLWVAFVLLVTAEFLTASVQFSIVFRLIPSALLLLWFVSYLAGRQRYQFKKEVNNAARRIVLVLKNIANITIIAGAVLRLMYMPYSQLLIVSGIGCLAIWSTFLIVVSEEKLKYNPEIIDDIQDDMNSDNK